MNAPCAHGDAVPVTLADGTAVAYLCPDCGTQLDAQFGDELARRARVAARQAACEHEDTNELHCFGAWKPVLLVCQDCGKDLAPQLRPDWPNSSKEPIR